MPSMPNPVIVIPGVIATYLRDEYPLPPESIWEVMESSKQFERASLHPDNLKVTGSNPVPATIRTPVDREKWPLTGPFLFLGLPNAI
jgi:hypothetical protein